MEEEKAKEAERQNHLYGAIRWAKSRKECLEQEMYDCKNLLEREQLRKEYMWTKDFLEYLEACVELENIRLMRKYLLELPPDEKWLRSQANLDKQGGPLEERRKQLENERQSLQSLWDQNYAQELDSSRYERRQKLKDKRQQLGEKYPELPQQKIILDAIAELDQRQPQKEKL